MKFRTKLSFIIRRTRRWSNQRGQTLVEFVLLLAVVSSLSFGFVSLVNQNIGSYWERAVNLVIHDKPGGTTAKLE